jgi:putative transposase
MPRSARHTPGGYVYHALNRATARLRLFRKPADYAAFLRVLDEALEEHPIRLLGYCLMPTHWHLVLWPECDDQLSTFLRWLTLTHAVRWHKHYHRGGSGHLYQNRFKAFAIETDEHLWTVVRYVERNPLRAGLVQRAEQWPWSSLSCRLAGGEVAARRLHGWPVACPVDWREWVNQVQRPSRLLALTARSIRRGRSGSPLRRLDGGQCPRSRSTPLRSGAACFGCHSTALQSRWHRPVSRTVPPLAAQSHS